eukprot:jgi/Mesen1/6359/ME000328S05651
MHNSRRYLLQLPQLSAHACSAGRLTASYSSTPMLQQTALPSQHVAVSPVGPPPRAEAGSSTVPAEGGRDPAVVSGSRLPGDPPQDTLLLLPGYVEVDAEHDRLFISDTGHSRIIIAEPNGRVIDYIGSTAGASDGAFHFAQLNHPGGTAYDPATDALYNNAIRRADLATGELHTLHPPPSLSEGRLQQRSGPSLWGCFLSLFSSSPATRSSPRPPSTADASSAISPLPFAAHARAEGDKEGGGEEKNDDSKLLRPRHVALLGGGQLAVASAG